jgi:hypothetical protein
VPGASATRAGRGASASKGQGSAGATGRGSARSRRSPAARARAEAGARQSADRRALEIGIAVVRHAVDEAAGQRLGDEMAEGGGVLARAPRRRSARGC